MAATSPYRRRQTERFTKLLLAFNRGVVSALGLSRLDVDRLTMSAEIQTNWVPRILGSMMLRPGLGHLGTTLGGVKGKYLPFQFSANDMAEIELTNNKMRVWVDDAPIMVVDTSGDTDVANPGFGTDIVGWVTDGTSPTAPVWATGGYLQLQGDGDSECAVIDATGVLSTSTPSFKIVIKRGPVTVSFGEAAVDDDSYWPETVLGEGTHILTLDTTTPVAVQIRLSSRTKYSVLADYAGLYSGNADNELEIDTTWATADLPNIRRRQSGDIVYVGCNDQIQRRIERRDNNSWSLVKYLPEVGPFKKLNVTETTLATSALSGDVTLTASGEIFKSTNIGSLIKIASIGQSVEVNLDNPSTAGALELWSDPIRVSGITTGRKFGIVITGTWTIGAVVGSKIRLQKSVGAVGNWEEVDATRTWVANVSTTYQDTQDNQIIYYRIGVNTVEEIDTGTASCALNYTSGSISGIARITAYTSPTVVDAVTLKAFGSVDPSPDWREGEWSDRRGYPSAVSLYEGRLWWAGRDRIWASESDAYETFDDEEEGDSAMISRTIGFGPIAEIHWLMALGRILMGTADNSADLDSVEITGNQVISGRSSSVDEPLSNANFNMKTISAKGIYVDRSYQRIYAIEPSETGSYLEDYGTNDLNLTAPDFNEVGITHIAVQYKPDMRIHCVREDGTVGMLVFDRAETVTCWVSVETDGLVEDVSVLPGSVEDQVYYTVNRAGVRYHEKWAQESECRGGDLSKLADSFISYTGAAITNITGLTHLNGELVVVWADGKDESIYETSPVTGAETHIGPIVSGGAITLAVAASNVVVGLPYTAQFKSAKLATLEDMGPNERKNIKQIGLTLYKTHVKGIKYGPSFTRLYDMRGVERGRELGEDEIHDQYEGDTQPFGGTWDTDSRVCLQAQAPRPVTVLGCKIAIQESEK